MSCLTRRRHRLLMVTLHIDLEIVLGVFSTSEDMMEDIITGGLMSKISVNFLTSCNAGFRASVCHAATSASLGLS